MTRYGMLIDLDRCINCGSCVMACKLEHMTYKNVYWCSTDSKEVGEYPNSKEVWMPHACMHCAAAPCIEECPVEGATYADEFGRVLVDLELCIGCNACVHACPYGARVEIEGSRVSYWADEGVTELSAFETSEATWTSRHAAETVEKCVFCHDRVDQGLQPACVKTCLSKARIFGDLDDASSELVKAINERGAKPFMESAGTQPSVYYAGSALKEFEA